MTSTDFQGYFFHCKRLKRDFSYDSSAVTVAGKRPAFWARWSTFSASNYWLQLRQYLIDWVSTRRLRIQQQILA